VTYFSKPESLLNVFGRKEMLLEDMFDGLQPYDCQRIF
jgi:hypothetical protein